MSPCIVVGSTNPAKTEAVKAMCERVFPGCRVVGIDVPSGVREQPIGEEETSRGARQRARAALAAVADARFGLGLEGGVDAEGHLINCVALVERDGRENLAWGVRFRLPPAAAARALQGEELGPVINALYGQTGGKGKLGAVGLLTNGAFTREEMWRGPVACAFMPVLHPALYGSPGDDQASTAGGSEPVKKSG